MLIGCSSQSNVKSSKVNTYKEESELKDPADSFIYETNKTKHTQTVIFEIESN